MRRYLCPARKSTFDGFVNYEGRRFGVPYQYAGQFARISRQGRTLYIYSENLRHLLITHEVTWSKRDSYFEKQYSAIPQPEEFPTVLVHTQNRQLAESESHDAFEKFNSSTTEKKW